MPAGMAVLQLVHKSEEPLNLVCICGEVWLCLPDEDFGVTDSLIAPVRFPVCVLQS